MPNRFDFYEFFAGGGMARLGLGDHWRCLFANDACEKKAASYRANFPPADELHVGDVAALSPADLPGEAALAWASFPCQDLSLAGKRAGLGGVRSGTFWAFWKLMQGLGAEGRRPPILVLENVTGLLTSRGGADFLTLFERLAEAGYKVGPLMMDAAPFCGQSRKRLFVVAVEEGAAALGETRAEGGPDPLWHPPALLRMESRIDAALRGRWAWWSLPAPNVGARVTLADAVDDDGVEGDGLGGDGVEDVAARRHSADAWFTESQCARLLDQMQPAHRERLEAIATNTGPQTENRPAAVFAAFRRMRPDGAGGSRQRVEVRFDGLSGCLRTPAGGSSRQILIFAGAAGIRARLISGREAARLMGAPNTYIIPEKKNEALKLFGDGLAAPVVAWLERHLLRQLAANILEAREVAQPH